MMLKVTMLKHTMWGAPIFKQKIWQIPGGAPTRGRHPPLSTRGPNSLKIAKFLSHGCVCRRVAVSKKLPKCGTVDLKVCVMVRLQMRLKMRLDEADFSLPPGGCLGGAPTQSDW